MTRRAANRVKGQYVRDSGTELSVASEDDPIRTRRDVVVLGGVVCEETIAMKEGKKAAADRNAREIVSMFVRDFRSALPSYCRLSSTADIV